MNHCRELYRVEQLPVLQNRMFTTEDEALSCAKGDVVLVQDMKTGLVFNQTFRPELMEYGQDYQNEQACSSVFRGHLDEVTSIIRHHFVGESLIEVGCGKGHFLEHLQAEGFSITGIDPAYEGVNPRIIKAPFDPALGIAADGIILRHVLEHVSDPVGFLTAIRNSNGSHGKVYIEVPCFDWICRHRACFDVYFEHVNYFRLIDFQHMFGVVHEARNIFGGQYLFVVADLSTLCPPAYSDECRVVIPVDFLSQIELHADLLKATEHGQHSALWGGASKGVIFALFMQRAGANIDLVVDINPAKQGKYLPASGLRVYSPDEAVQMLEPGAFIFVMNSNYLEEIKQLTNNKFSYVDIDREHF